LGSTVDEVAELIAEGISTPVVTAGSAVLSATRSSVRDSLSTRAVEPSSSATEIGLSESKNFNSLEALTAPLSVESVTSTQGLATVDPNEQSPLEVEDPIGPDTALNAPLNPGDVTGSQEAAKKISEVTEEEEPKGSIEKAKAEGSKLVGKKDEKGPDGLTEEERQKVEELKRRDAEVRAHEQAHSSAGGPYAGAPRLQFTRGPDGRFYAVAGEVSIDTSVIPGNPQATLRKMRQVKRAALAPHEPSSQDRRVAAEADRKILQARQEIREQENEEVKKSQTKQKQREAEAQGFERSITPEQAPVFDPESRFRSNIGGTGPARSTGLAGAGGLDVDASDAIDARVLFSLVA
jgi:hypothetical protein